MPTFTTDSSHGSPPRPRAGRARAASSRSGRGGPSGPSLRVGRRVGTPLPCGTSWPRLLVPLRLERPVGRPARRSRGARRPWRRRRSCPAGCVRHDGAGVLVALPDGARPLDAAAPARSAARPSATGWRSTATSRWRCCPATSLLSRRSAGADTPQALAANVDARADRVRPRPPGQGRAASTGSPRWRGTPAPCPRSCSPRPTSPPIPSRVDAVAAAHPGLDVVATSATTARASTICGALVGRPHGRARRRVRRRQVVAHQRPARRRGRWRPARSGAGDAKGRHTTTSREPHPLPSGGVLIDTPGLRAVGLWADREAVAATFADIDDLAAGCRFSDCGHGGEPGAPSPPRSAAGALAPDGSRLAGARARGRGGRAPGRAPPPAGLRAALLPDRQGRQRRKGRD